MRLSQYPISTLKEVPSDAEVISHQLMLRTGMIRRHNDIVDVRFERIPNTYPLYTLNYRRKLAANTEVIARFNNLLNLGRTGSFWYNNQDHSIKQAMDVAAAYLKNPAIDHLREVGYSRVLE